jgi:membrane fusion protein, multidrug efflux system
MVKEIGKKISKVKTQVRDKIRSHEMTKRMVIMLAFLMLLFGGIFGFKFLKVLFMGHPPQPVVTVSAIPAQFQDWQPKLRAVGTLSAVQGVDLTTELAGVIKEIRFIPGKPTKVGELLVQLNADSEVAQRDALHAMVDLAEITYKRDKAQFAISAVSKATLDFDKADLKNKKALLAQQEAIVAKKTIRAPFSGRLGISAVRLGQYLNTGDKIVTLQSLDPIYVDFTIPQQSLAAIKVGQKVSLKAEPYTDQAFIGEITSINPKVDIATRNIQVQATISNPEMRLYPGMFGEVEIYTGEPQRYLTLPKTAISFNPFGEIIYIIHETDKDKTGKPVLTVKQSFVTVGSSRGDQIAIHKGLEEGKLVVSAGQQKLKNGTVVAINNAIVPDNDPAPDLQDE